MSDISILSMTLEGTDEMKARLQELIKRKREQVKMALDSVLAEMVNWIKTNHESLGGWINRTRNLENSISHQVFDDGNSIKGVIYAGMEYAVYVEYREHHWVISGAMTNFRDKILGLIIERVEAQK